MIDWKQVKVGSVLYFIGYPTSKNVPRLRFEVIDLGDGHPNHMKSRRYDAEGNFRFVQEGFNEDPIVWELEGTVPHNRVDGDFS